LIPGDFTSGKLIKMLMNREMPAVPKIMLGIVDVRDCAMAHLLAIKVDEAKDQRILLSARSLWLRDVAVALSEQYGKWYNIPTSDLKFWMIKLASWFNKEAA
jgi:dihydroflavonol-4-reductase